MGEEISWDKENDPIGDITTMVNAIIEDVGVYVPTVMKGWGYFCTACECLCHPYEQGLTCCCGNPWENEYFDEKLFPDKWIKVRIIAYRREK